MMKRVAAAGRTFVQFPLTMLYFPILHETNAPVLGLIFTLSIDAGELLAFVGGIGNCFI